jgi:hypothetical protein
LKAFLHICYISILALYFRMISRACMLKPISSTIRIFLFRLELFAC